MERVLTQLVEKLKKAHQERLTSVILYGSAAVGDHHGRFSDINILCVLSQVTPRELGESSAIVRWWRDLGNPSPLMLSEQEVRTSTDCFAIEFHDIKERRRVLYGADVVADLAIHDVFYRAQVEYELRAKLLRLRQKAAGILGDRDLMRSLLADSLSTFCVLFRHALRLAGRLDAPFEKRAILEQARVHFAIDPAPFAAVLDFREGKLKPREFDPGEVFPSYLKQIQTAIECVDRLAK